MNLSGDGLSTAGYLGLLAVTFLVVGALTPLMRRIAINAEILDHPKSSHKTHSNPTPYLGGVAIIIGIVTITYLALILDGSAGNLVWIATSLLVPATVLGLIGLLDDIRNLPALPRFIAQTIAGIASAAVLIATDTVGNPTGNSALDAVITVIWVVGISNSINFFDNLDGGAAGAVAMTSLGTFLIARDNGQTFIAALSAVTFGAMLGFLLWNKSPARIYMGDAGALFLGVLVAVTTLRLNPQVDGKVESFAIPIALLAVPILDTCVAVLSRIRRGISPFQGGRDHLSHRLMRLGLSKRHSAYTLWALAGLFAMVANVIAHSPQGAQMLVALAAAFWLGLFIFFFNTKDSD
jgi:UDP-GlcNAc:undecaprenyl-phosphate GlcNAc-1-phosphate transferase